VAHPYTLLINSCDAFEDCWQPFFTLLERYWPAPLPPVLLNTERKRWRGHPSGIICSQVQGNQERRLSWSECLDAALLQVKTPLVLYMQEDYFIERPVDAALIDALAARMVEQPDIAHIGLTHFGAGRMVQPTPDALLWEIGPRASYRISTQAALWRVDALRSYLLPWESGWMFEIFGTVRAWKRQDTFLTLARNRVHPAITYQHTGIVKGQWSAFVPPLFARENIDMNFNRRGFYRPTSALVRRLKLIHMLLKQPTSSIRSILAP
jgi:hypothetical protein